MDDISIEYSSEYRAIEDFYGERCAKRSGVRLMNHIDEGIFILGQIGADYITKKAYCLHPLFQKDEDFESVGFESFWKWNFQPLAVAYAIEYRHLANAWLSDKVTMYQRSSPALGVCLDGYPDQGNIGPVRNMLIADKVQNYKDFLTYHQVSHPRTMEIDCYFKAWLQELDINNDEFKSLCKSIDDYKAKK
jgi:hypothetical protein